jgi:hypothetical protein
MKRTATTIFATSESFYCAWQQKARREGRAVGLLCGASYPLVPVFTTDRASSSINKRSPDLAWSQIDHMASGS